MKKLLLLLLCSFVTFTLEAKPLPASEVFQVEVKRIDPNTFSVDWKIIPGYFLYSDRIAVNTQANSEIQLGPLRLPKPLTKTDKQGKSYSVYRDNLTLPVSVLSSQPGEALVQLNYQGCADDGFCYPPEKRNIKLTSDMQLALSQVALEPLSKPTTPTKQDDKISKVFTEHNWAMTLLMFFGFGLLLSFTPCILPMVPVLSGIIVGHGKDITTKKAFFLSLSYVLSMSVTYAFVGAVVALVGANLQISMQSPWAIGVFSVLFILLALSMFGFYEFKLPQAWQSKIAGTGSQARRGHYLGAAIMGSLSTLILSPCVTAPLIGVLTYIAQTGNILVGSVTLFVLSLGMGTPLLLIGTSAGRLLPQTGSWMNAVKAFFGILLLGVAIELLSRLIPPSLSMGLWASLLVFSGIYAGALTHASTNQEKFFQGIGILLLGYGLLILVGASLGSTNPLQPLANIQAAKSPVSLQTQSIKTLSELQNAIKEAQGNPVMLDFYADWCASCKVMEATTFKDPKVAKLLSQFTVLKIDVTDNNEANKEIMRHFNVVAPPTYLFFDTKGEPLKALTIVGEKSPDEFFEALKQAQG